MRCSPVDVTRAKPSALRQTLYLLDTTVGRFLVMHRCFLKFLRSDRLEQFLLSFFFIQQKCSINLNSLLNPVINETQLRMLRNVLHAT